jgi:hypothetical protein
MSSNILGTIDMAKLTGGERHSHLSDVFDHWTTKRAIDRRRINVWTTDKQSEPTTMLVKPSSWAKMSA